MTLKIYNTLSRKKEDFVPLNPPQVNMYVCGVTVYDDCHLGHARAVITFDMVYRYLLHRGYEVKYVRNFTDIDDKIINRANEQGVAWNEISEKYIEHFHRDMDALGNLKPSLEPKATDNIQSMLNLISKLEEKGFAYPAGDDVVYAVRKKEDYGKLSGKKIDELESGARIEVTDTKKDPLDFVLWKASKPGEPSWESPWKPGRPGWHIECSAMSMEHLGETLDIHGGGRDLSFPHHENEIAQSEGATGKQFARYWIHNGFIQINSEKMSKSLGNFLTIHELLKTFHPEVIRLFILSAHYRSPLDYTEKNIHATQQSLTRWYTTLDRIRTSSKHDSESSSSEILSQKIQSLVTEFEQAMDDDFNTAKVVGLLFDLSREWNKFLDENQTVNSKLVENFEQGVQKIHEVLGIFGSSAEEFLTQCQNLKLDSTAITPEVIEQKLQERIEARKQKDWAKADAIRDELQNAGVQIKDNPDGTTSWNLN